jgi:TatD DNase family protein
MMIDTHSHLYQPDFDADAEAMLERARKAGVSKVYLPAIDSSTHQRMMDFALAHEGYCVPMMGLHPCYVDAGYMQELKVVEDWLSKASFAAIGEIGLDYYHSTEFKKEQVDAFTIQLHWALDRNLPIVIHTRSAMDDCIRLIEQEGAGKTRGIFHCFGGDERQARQIIDMGFMLGIGGVVTYKNAGLADVVAALPLDVLVLETDAPYLSPVPFRGKRNESSYLTCIAEKIAEVKGMAVEEVMEATTRNAEKIFGC